MAILSIHATAPADGQKGPLIVGVPTPHLSLPQRRDRGNIERSCSTWNATSAQRTEDAIIQPKPALWLRPMTILRYRLTVRLSSAQPPHNNTTLLESSFANHSFASVCVANNRLSTQYHCSHRPLQNNSFSAFPSIKPTTHSCHCGSCGIEQRCNECGFGGNSS